MVQLNNQIVQEYQFVKVVSIRCKNCYTVIDDFANFIPRSRRIWAIKFNEMDWDFEMKFNGNACLCMCGNYLGRRLNDADLLIQKSTVEPFY